MLGIVGCKKDDIHSRPLTHVVDEEINCIDFGIILWQLLQFNNPLEHQHFVSASFNPFDANEIVYVESKFIQSNFVQLSIVIYDIQTKQKQIIHTITLGTIIFQEVSWSRHDYIFWKRSNIVDASGGAQILNNGAPVGASISFGPDISRPFMFWGYDQPELYFYRVLEAGSGFRDVPAYLIKRHVYNGAPEDTLGIISSNPTAMFENKIASKQVINGQHWLGYYDLNAGLPLSVSNFTPLVELKGRLSSITWHPDAQSFFISYWDLEGQGRGMYQIGLDGSINLLMEYCSTLHYDQINCSPDGKHLVGSRVQTRLIDPNGEYVVSNMKRKVDLYLIDLTTLKQTKLIKE